MSGAMRISLGAAAQAVRRAQERQKTLAAGRTARPSSFLGDEKFDLEALAQAARSLEWLAIHGDAVRALLSLPADIREAVTVVPACELRRRLGLPETAAEGTAP